MNAIAGSNQTMTNIKSTHSVGDTLNKLEEILVAKGMNVFARIDHAAAATKAGMELRPTELIIFGNPEIGTKLMNSSQSIAIDLPLKMLGWQDADGTVWLSYNNPEFLKNRHATEGCDQIFEKVAGALSNFAEAATQ